MNFENRSRLSCIVLTLVLALVAPAALAEEGASCGKLASVQNDVTTRRADSESWQPSTRNELLYARDRVRTGATSRAAILYSDQTLHRINERSEVEVLPPQADNPGVLKVISGKHYFSSRRPKDYGRIETPTVTAAIRGTEFAVDIDDDGTTLITMLEGVVDASNSFGSLRVSSGEAAFVQPGKAPVKRVVVRPRDAVTWSLYYPRILGGADAARIESMGESGRGLARAAELLYSGQVDQATPLIDKARQESPDNPIALALSSVIDVVADRKDDARQKAQRAHHVDPKSPAAALALSFSNQADFDIAAARDMAEKAALLDPDNAEARSRVAELRLAEGDVEGARDAAEQAVRRDPNSARAMSVLGFVELAELKTDDAIETFGKAVELDPGFPMARLGHGIATFRKNMAAGREEMQTAAILDPDNSLLRSYLAKAYYEEGREYEAEKELAIAKELDPSDPTPYLYDAILKQTYNRPVEALRELQQSIELNDNRAVYRSRLLLDQDLAVRSADLAGIYNDLGFDQLGMVTARNSADIDQSNHSSHLFLAGTYRNLPGFAPAFLSETLQARIYQPVGVNAVRPDVVNEAVSFNEYTSLFDRPRIRAFAGATHGWTDESGLYPSGILCSSPGGFLPCNSLLNDSTTNQGDLTLTMNRDRFAGAVAFNRAKTDGFRPNSDQDTETLRAFFVFAPTAKDQFQLNVIEGSRTTGDLPIGGFPATFAASWPEIDTELTNVGLGYHRIISPAADLAVSVIYSDTEQNSFGAEYDFFGNQMNESRSEGTFEGTQVEVQYVLRQQHVHWTAGVGHYDGEQTVEGSFELLVPFPSPPVTSSFTADDEFSNAYVYAKLPDIGRLSITAGLSAEDVSAPIGFIPPRNSQFGLGDVQLEDDQLSGKLGLSFQATGSTVLRATAYSRLTPAIGRLQTLEPTQVAGFNQFFRDRAGTSSRNFGIGLDQQFGDRVFAGLSLLSRDLDIPEAYCSAPDPFLGCSSMPVDILVGRESEDLLGNLYLNGTVGRRVALSVEFAYEEREFDFTQKNRFGNFQDYIETHRIRPQLRFFMPKGLYASIRGTHFDQRVHEFDDAFGVDLFQTPDFWIGDLEVGVRLPKRIGSVALRMLNFSDREYTFYFSSLEEDVIPARTVLLSLNFTSR